jgi:MYXO-CTERM domain-containing protein
MEGECFGLPHGGMIAGIVFGIIIILFGLGLFLQASGYIGNFWNIFWPIILVIFGLLMLLGALFGRRRHTQT